MTQPVAIDIPKDELAEFCQDHSIGRLSLFGSVLNDDFTANSAVDIFAEFQPSYTPGWACIVHLEEELELLIGRRVNLKCAELLNDDSVQQILNTALVLYGPPL
ncbi:MAG: nucleotidyltransferase domain-containing protein [Cyanobacteriota bacterium]